MLQLIWVLLRNICFILGLLTFGLTSGVCVAQDDLAFLDREPERSIRESARNYDTPQRSQSEVEDTTYLFRSLRCNIYPNFSDYWTDYANQPSMHIEYEYAGLQKVIYNQIEKFANRYYNQHARQFWQQTYLHPMDQDRAIRAFNDEFNGRQWWHRSWRASLPVEKGGERTYTHQIGERIEVLRLGSLALTNEGKVSCNIWRFDVEDNPEYAQNDMIALRNGELLDKYNIGIRTPEASIKEKQYEMRWNMRANVRFDNLTNENKSELGVGFDFRYLNKDGEPCLRFQANLRVQPFTQQAEIRCQLVLLEF